MFRKRSVLIISPEPWDHIFVSKHHYAVHLAQRGNQVYFLNPPTGSPVSITDTEYLNLRVINYSGFAKGLRLLPVFVQKWLIKRVFDKIQQLTGPLEVVWSFDNSVFFNFDALPDEVLKISHIVDLNQDFEFEMACRTADICFGTTRYIIERQKKFNPNSHFIHHGLSTSRVDNSKSIKLPGKNKVKALYLGNLSMAYIDWEVIWQAARTIDIDFIFIGSNQSIVDLSVNPLHTFKQQVLSLENAYFLPSIGSAQIQGHLKVADVLFVAYQQSHHKDQANPHKMMEYMSSGTPVITSYTEEYADMADCVAMSRNNSDWPDLFRNVVENLDQWNAKSMITKRTDFAANHTYDRQLDLIQEKINGI